MKSYDLDLTTEDNQKLKKLMNGDVTDEEIENAIFRKVKEMQKVTLTATSNEQVDWQTLEYSDDMSVSNSEMTKEMEEYAIDCAKRAYKRSSKEPSTPGFIKNEFERKYG